MGNNKPPTLSNGKICYIEMPATDINGSASFDLRGRSGSAVLLWITNLGAADRVEIAEAQLTR